MMLAWLFLLPFFGGIAAWLSGRGSSTLPRWIALGSLSLPLVGLLGWRASLEAAPASDWLAEVRWSWIPSLGITVHLALDGLSFLLVVLALVLGVVSVLVSWKGISQRVGFFHFNLLWILAGTIGVFLALDLFLFFFLWELMIIPMYLLIGIWGHERRHYAAIKFFLFTQGSGLLMLAAILGLHFVHRAQTSVATFGYLELLGTELPAAIGMWLMLGFFVAFAVKLPAFPFHPWLADAHTEAPTAGSVVLAGLLLKTGAYGMIRFVLPLFPDAAARIGPLAMTLGVIGILYGAVLAFAQTDLKRLVAYTSVSHMGFVLLGIFAGTPMAVEGVVMQMICHGLSTGALFILAGGIQDRIHTRDLDRMGGFWPAVPRMGGFALFFAVASLGLPGLGNFVAEFLVLLGSFEASRLLTVLAALGIVAAAVYSLWIIQRVFHGEPRTERNLTDLDGREAVVLGAMAVALVWLGLNPQPVLETARPTVERILESGAARAAYDPRGPVAPATAGVASFKPEETP